MKSTEKSRRDVNFKKVIAFVRKSEKWSSPKEVIEKTGLHHRTVDDGLKRGKRLDIFQHNEAEGQYAWIEFIDRKARIREAAKTPYLLLMKQLVEHVEDKRSGSLDLSHTIEVFIKEGSLFLGEDPKDRVYRKYVYEVFAELFNDPQRFFEPSTAKMLDRLFPELKKQMNQRVSEFLDREGAEQKGKE